MTIAMRGLVGRLLMLTVATVAFLCAPALAEAAVVTRDENTLIITEDDPGGVGGVGATQVLETNVITVVLDGTDYVVTDTGGSALTARTTLGQPACTAVAGTVRCPASGITEFDIDAGELADVVDIDHPSLPDSLTSTVDGGTGADTLLGLDGGADTLNGQDDGDSLFGNAGNDILSGGQGTDVLRGGEGDDTLRGGADADDFHGDGGEDTVSYSDSAVNVYAKIDPNVKSGAGCVNGGGEGCEGDQINVTVENLTGGSGNDTLIGSEDVGNELRGGGGNDRLEGLSGGDLLEGDAGNDVLYGGSGADTLNGGANDDRLQGGIDNDVMNGGGQAGDIVDYTDRVGANIDHVTVDLNVATPTNGGAKDGSAGSRDTITGVNHADTGDGDDTLTGNASANTFNTGLGADTMNGKAGNDTFNAGGGDDAMTGEAGNDTFNAGDGDDAMNGGAGADTFNGGAGERDHVTYVDDPNDADDTAGGVVVSIGTGTGDDGGTNDGAAGSRDTVAADVEDVTGGPDNDTITGSSNDNILHGGGGNDTLAGLAGPDLLYGDDGFDTVTYAQPERTTTVLVDLDTVADDGNALDGSAENPAARDLVDGLTVEAIVGGAGDDRLSGNEVANALTGGNGNDILRGGLGADVFNGGDGEDSVIYVDDGRAAGTGVIVSIGDSANDGTGGATEGDNVGADVENLVGTDSNDTLTGDIDPNKIFGLGGTDAITGNAGDDVLDGGAGAGDNLDGGSGDDLLHLGSQGTVSDGADSVNGSVDEDTITYASVFVANPTHPLAAFASQERTEPVRVTLAGGADDGQITPAENDSVLGVENATGGAGDDELIGTATANTLDGGPGDDRLTPGNESGTQSDTLIGGPGAHDLADYSDRDSHDLIITLDGEANDGVGGEGGESDDIRSDVEDVTTGNGNDDVTGSTATANIISTEGGNDTVRTNDTTADDVDCGAGTDSATADHRDKVQNCENTVFTSKAKLSVADAQVTEGDSGTTNLQFKVTVDAAPGSAVTFQYATSEGTATDPEDFTHQSGQGTIPAGATETTITVPVVGDTIDEANETLTLTISNPSSNGEILDGTATGTIVDNEGTPSVSVGDASTTEGNTGTQVLNFPVTLSGTSDQDVTVKYSTGGGNATAGSDYTAATDGTVTIPAGQLTANAPVTIAGDTIDEENETFTVTLSAPTNATLGDPTATGTITDNDDPPSLSIADASTAEGNAGTKTLTFTATLSQASGKPVTFTYSTSNGTATAGAQGDYLAATDVPVTIPAGSTTANVDVTVRGDTTPEADETFTVTLAGVTNATVTDNTATGTITDDDQPGISVDDKTVAEDDANATFTVTLSQASGKTVTVAYTTADGTATEPGDYTTTSGTLTFAPDETTKTVDVPVKEDALDEADETFTLELSAPTNSTLDDASGTGTITDDDATPSLSVGDATVKEGDSGTTDVTFTIKLSEASGRPVEVKFATAGDTAEVGSDLPASGGLVSFTPGTTERQVTVAVNGDMTDEPDETFKFTLSEPLNATLGDAEAIGTITDDDQPATNPPVVPAISVGDIKVAEGDTGTTPAVFTVTLSAPTTVAVTVKYVTSDGTATSGADYAVTAGTLTFAPGETTKTVSVPIMGDRLDESDEAFALALVQPVNATLAKSAGAGLITDDESPRLAPVRVSSKTTPSRDRALPYRFRTTGRVTLPSGVRRSDACAGKVQVRFKAGKKTISSRRVSLRSDCTFRRSVKFGIKSRLKPGRLKVEVRFLGNAVLLPKSAPRRFVRAG